MHMQKYHGEETDKCEECDNRSLFIGILKIHMTVHNGLQPSKMKIWQLCNATCLCRSALIIHMNKYHRKVSAHVKAHLKKC